MIDESKFTTKEELFAYLKENKKDLIAQKKFEMKRADAISLCCLSSEAVKSTADLLSKEELTATLIINTTNYFDSHRDVHIDGLWKKTLAENKNLYHLREHKLSFDHVISDEIKAYTKTYTWKELGVNAKGSTQALVFDSKIRKSRNPFMFDQYAKGFVKNHSVGMRYVQLTLAINSEAEFNKEEKTIWDKYIDRIVNKEDAEDVGYFWAVTEGKAAEGSAVVVGSNRITPTQSIKTDSSIESFCKELEAITSIEYSEIKELASKHALCKVEPDTPLDLKPQKGFDLSSINKTIF